MVSVQVAVLALLASGGDQTVMLDFYADWCGPCQEMHSTVDELARSGYPVKKVNIDRQPELAARYGAERVPCFVVVSNGRAVSRHIGQASLQQLKQMFPSRTDAADRAGEKDSENDSIVIPHSEVPPVILDEGTDDWSPGTERSEDLGHNEDSSERSESSIGGPRAVGFADPPSHEPRGPEDIFSRLMAASVRLKVDDPDGHSYASGTIIDAQGGEALAVTCAHVFRDSRGKGRVSVDLFGLDAPQGLPARVICYDLESDVGLISFRTDSAGQAVRVAPAGYQVRRGDRVISIGCNNGDPPTARHSRVTGLDKFLGPPNLQVAGQPVTGRSGGGLFTPDGLLIGICNAADPADNEGLYAALASVHAELDRARLSEVYGRGGAQLANAASGLPRMPERMPSAERWDDATAVAVDDRGASEAGMARGRGQLSSLEQATLEEISQQAESAEVICIIRSHANPRNKSEIIVLDRASADFLRSLADERHVQDARHLTSLEVRRAPASGKRLATPRSEKKKTSNWRPHWLQPSEPKQEARRGPTRQARPRAAADSQAKAR